MCAGDVLFIYCGPCKRVDCTLRSERRYGFIYTYALRSLSASVIRRRQKNAHRTAVAPPVGRFWFVTPRTERVFETLCPPIDFRYRSGAPLFFGPPTARRTQSGTALRVSDGGRHLWAALDAASHLGGRVCGCGSRRKRALCARAARRAHPTARPCRAYPRLPEITRDQPRSHPTARPCRAG